MENNTTPSSFFGQVWASIAATIVLCIICCGIYPMLIWAVGQAVFPNQANGSLVKRDGASTTDDMQAVGSALLGQNFSAAGYFHPRPSAAGNGYDPTASGGSNFGPTNQKLLDAVRQRCDAYRAENHLSGSTLIPADAVTASASGLDPHISPANAKLQADRVAAARHITLEQVQELVDLHTDQPAFGIIGEPGVNVLMLNLALDAKYPVPRK